MSSQPTVSSVHIDAALSNVSVAYVQQETNFIASRVFPTVPVARSSDKYFVYTKNDWFRDEAQIRPPATESAGSGYNIGTASYNCDVYAMHKDVPDQLVANADPVIDPEADAARFVAQRMLLKHEIEWSATFFVNSIWGTSSTPSALWDVYATSTPIQDVRTARKTILSSTGFEPNTMVLGYDVYSALLDHPDFVDRIKYSTTDNVTQAIMARLLEVDRLFVARAVRATNLEGETAAYSFVQGKHALLCYSAPSPSLMLPSAGYTFVWDGVSDGMGLNVGTVRIEMPLKRAVRVESQMAWDSKLVASDMGYFFNSVVS